MQRIATSDDIESHGLSIRPIMVHRIWIKSWTSDGYECQWEKYEASWLSRKDNYEFRFTDHLDILRKRGVEFDEFKLARQSWALHAYNKYNQLQP